MTTTNYSLVGDIGGTNARFALVRSGKVTPEAVKVLACRDYNQIECALGDYLQSAGIGAGQVHSACLAVAANQAAGGQVKMTNNHWHFDREELRSRFGWNRLEVINDFTAMALGIPHVAAGNQVHVCGGPGDAGQPQLVIGPGTGLGVSCLMPSSTGWTALMTEGGHVDFAPTDDTEMALLNLLKARFGRVSVERILSGQGLLDLYRAHGVLQGATAPLDTPEQITAAALAGSDPLAGLTLRHFCEILGRVAGNAVLTLGSTGGVYLCGGMLPQFSDFFLSSPFRKGFEDKGRMRPMLEFTPVYLVTERYTGLLGAAQWLVRDSGQVQPG